MNEHLKNSVVVLKALADETRLKIVDMLTSGELCACKILEQFQITQPTLSYHMKLLCESGVVIGRREGAWMKYSLNVDALTDLMELFENINKVNLHRESCGCSDPNKC